MVLIIYFSGVISSDLFIPGSRRIRNDLENVFRGLAGGFFTEWCVWHPGRCGAATGRDYALLYGQYMGYLAALPQLRGEKAGRPRPPGPVDPGERRERHPFSTA
jgi:hypothetical protein